MYRNRGMFYHLVSTQAGVNITPQPALSLDLCRAVMNKVSAAGLLSISHFTKVSANFVLLGIE